MSKVGELVIEIVLVQGRGGLWGIESRINGQAIDYVGGYDSEQEARSYARLVIDGVVDRSRKVARLRG